MRAKLMRKKLRRFLGPIGIGALAVIVVSVAAAAMLFAARQPAQPAPDAQTEDAAPAAAMKKAPVAKAVSPSTRGAPATRAASGPVAKTVATTAVVPASTAAGQEQTDVTMTGCLARNDRMFRLRDTEGVNAPKSRSWKSGFLKKHSADVVVLDAANRLQLSKYVGQRVTLTGTVVDREMRARSVASVSRSCS